LPNSSVIQAPILISILGDIVDARSASARRRVAEAARMRRRF